MPRILPVMVLTPFATSCRTEGRYLADAVLGRTAEGAGSSVDRAHVTRSSEESYDPQRQREVRDAVEWLTRARIAWSNA